MKKEKEFDFKSLAEKKQYVRIPADILSESDSVELDLELTLSETKMVLGRNARCVSVDTFSFAPLGRKEKKCLRGRVTSLSFDAPSMKRRF
tara:strand:- start:4843 stop:5115 length:273 start_codon:yes stop_codon:yes gene_type:complete